MFDIVEKPLKKQQRIEKPGFDAKKNLMHKSKELEKDNVKIRYKEKGEIEPAINSIEGI